MNSSVSQSFYDWYCLTNDETVDSTQLEGNFGDTMLMLFQLVITIMILIKVTPYSNFNGGLVTKHGDATHA